MKKRIEFYRVGTKYSSPCKQVIVNKTDGLIMFMIYKQPFSSLNT